MNNLRHGLAIIFCALSLIGCQKNTALKPPIPAVSTKPTVGDRQFTLGSQYGKSSGRSYTVYVPGCTPSSGKWAAVLAYHAGLADSSIMEKISLWDATADSHCFLAVYPEGTQVGSAEGYVEADWNANGKTGASDDVQYTKSVIQDLEKNFSMDHTSIYLTGMSNGAQMVFYAAFNLSNMIAAGAPVEATQAFSTSSSITNPVPWLQVNQTGDPCILYNGGQCGGCGESLVGQGPQNWTCYSIPNVVFPNWVKYEGMKKGVTSATTTPFSSPAGTTLLTDTSSATGATPVSLLTLPKGGHTWPDGNYGPGCNFQNKNPFNAKTQKLQYQTCQNSINTLGPILTTTPNLNEYIWAFFGIHHNTKAP
jgi:polyhydroxybutyrate depolymerase